jgi:CheY-like chemotaxis protein
MVDSSKHILVVDDNVDSAEMLGEVLRGEEPRRFTVEVVFDGKQALDAASHRRPDTVVMDIEMPVMNGLLAALELRANPSTANAHLIAVSGRADHISRVLRMETAFHHGLVKPVDVEELVKLIDAGAGSG